MYYESYLSVDLGDDPRRPRPARQLLRNLYLLHQRISEAFGRDPRKEQNVKEKVPRGGNVNWVLFRVMAPTGGVLVRSGSRPAWERAFRKHSMKDMWLHVTERPSVAEVQPECSAGDRFRFSLRANPTVKKLRTVGEGQKSPKHRVSLCYPRHARDYLLRHGEAVSDEAREAVEGEGPDGRELRRKVVDDALLKWLDLKGECGGFDVERALPIQEGFRHLRRPRLKTRGDSKPDMSFRSVLYEGTLQVTDPEDLVKTLCKGIGPAKAFGFGLLSVAPCR